MPTKKAGAKKGGARKAGAKKAKALTAAKKPALGGGPRFRVSCP